VDGLTFKDTDDGYDRTDRFTLSDSQEAGGPRDVPRKVGDDGINVD
jgi:hypothetical protein